MKIYMIRHGETDWNKKRKLQGQVDIPLNEFGKLLAKETAPALADVPFAVCYTSPLKRAAETAIAPKTRAQIRRAVFPIFDLRSNEAMKEAKATAAPMMAT